MRETAGERDQRVEQRLRREERLQLQRDRRTVRSWSDPDLWHAAGLIAGCEHDGRRVKVPDRPRPVMIVAAVEELLIRVYQDWEPADGVHSEKI